MNRRHFIKLAACSAATLALSSAGVFQNDPIDEFTWVTNATADPIGDMRRSMSFGVCSLEPIWISMETDRAVAENPEYRKMIERGEIAVWQEKDSA